MFEKVKRFYEKGLYSREQVHRFVEKGVLTEEQYLAILGEKMAEDEAEARDQLLAEYYREQEDEAWK